MCCDGFQNVVGILYDDDIVGLCRITDGSIDDDSEELGCVTYYSINDVVTIHDELGGVRAAMLGHKNGHSNKKMLLHNPISCHRFKCTSSKSWNS